MADAATKLARVEAAIEKLEASGASSYSIGNRTKTSLQLETLYKERRYLENQVFRQTSSGSFSRGVIGGKRR